MRFGLFLLSGCLTLSAGTLINSTFGSGDPGVIGDPAYFDVQSISVSLSGSTLSATVNFNYDDGLTGSGLSPFTISGFTPAMEAGDLFFYDPSTPGALAYGVAVESSRPNSNAFVAGDLYAIGGEIGTEDAEEALGSPAGDYGSAQTVLMVDTAGTPGAAATGVETILNTGDNGTGSGPDGGAEYSVVFSFSVPAGFLALLSDGQIGVMFESADCGNAVLSGVVDASAPEPATLGLMAAGVGLMAFGLMGARLRRG